MTHVKLDMESMNGLSNNYGSNYNGHFLYVLDYLGFIAC